MLKYSMRLYFMIKHRDTEILDIQIPDYSVHERILDTSLFK